MILPYNPNMAGATAAAIVDFLSGGGKLISSYSVPDKVAAGSAASSGAAGAGSASGPAQADVSPSVVASPGYKRQQVAPGVRAAAFKSVAFQAVATACKQAGAPPGTEGSEATQHSIATPRAEGQPVKHKPRV